MCGITGFIVSERDSQIQPRELLLDKMCKIITHRGPDEQGTAIEGRAALGMRRLSIIDLKTGQQPIYNEDKSLVIVFNGEIYNYRELKRELESVGHSFRTNSDTEAIIHAYEEYGESCVEKLRGMFAFAIWNKRQESLFIARDRVGKKPLFYSLTDNGTFIFGSELKSLLLHPEFRREIDFAAFDSYLTFGYVPEEFCIFKNVFKLQPGHTLTFADGNIATNEFWDFPLGGGDLELNEDEIALQLRELIKESVGIRLISEVPLGAFLSGGVDSSTVVGMMSEVSNKPVKTFSIGFNEDSFNELKYARIAARHFNTEHHEFIVTPDLVDVVEELVWHFDEPFADSSALPTFMVSKMARDFVTVVLSGDGGDELFAGYTRYVVDRKRRVFEHIPKIFRRGLGSVGASLPENFFGKNFLYNSSLDPIDRYTDNVSHFNREKRRKLYSKEFLKKLDGSFGCGENLFERIAARRNDADSLEKLLYLDSKTYLPSDILVKVDRMSMAASLEARVPLLDHKLIEFVSRIPSSLKMRGLETKYIFRKAVRGIVPDEILDRPKQGFGVPINEWINDQLRERIHGELSEKRTLERGYFNRSYIRDILDEHSRGRRDHSHSLWMLWMLELWHRRYVDQ